MKKAVAFKSYLYINLTDVQQFFLLINMSGVPVQ